MQYSTMQYLPGDVQHVDTSKLKRSWYHLTEVREFLDGRSSPAAEKMRRKIDEALDQLKTELRRREVEDGQRERVPQL